MRTREKCWNAIQIRYQEIWDDFEKIPDTVKKASERIQYLTDPDTLVAVEEIFLDERFKFVNDPAALKR